MSIIETQRARRGHRFLPPKAIRVRTPKLYSTEATPCADKVLWCKWFVAGATWYAAEVDWDTGLAFGYVDNGPGSEWGYFDLCALESGQVASWLVVERDCFWEPVTFGEL